MSKISWHPDFAPSYTPEEMLKLGIFEGKYINNIDGLPEHWYKIDKVLGPDDPPDPKINKYGVKSRESLSAWKEKGYIMTDANGWFHWYCMYFLGRRLGDEDLIQIKRFRSFIARHQAQIKNNCKLSDDTCRPRQRQGLLQWAWDSNTNPDPNTLAKNLAKIRRKLDYKTELTTEAKNRSKEI